MPIPLLPASWGGAPPLAGDRFYSGVLEQRVWTLGTPGTAEGGNLKGARGRHYMEVNVPDGNF